MICPQCNAKNPEGDPKCSHCGAILPERDELDSSPGTMSSMNTTMAPKDIEGNLKKGVLFAGRYEILNDGFRGGMGMVYKVKDKTLGKISALKLILPAFLQNEKAVSRFKQEVAITVELSHENIVRVYDIGEAEGMIYFTMEWIDGISMREYIAERKKHNNRLSFAEVKYLMKQICSALSYAHNFSNKSIIHRDVKPENILMVDAYSKNPKLKITDFGIAKAESQVGHATTSTYMGTPIYMAPEQYSEAHLVDKRADVYSVGVILYELMTFMHPLGTFSMPTEVDPSLPKKVDDIIRKALSADRTKRYDDAKDIVKALDDATVPEKPVAAEKIEVKETPKPTLQPEPQPQPQPALQKQKKSLMLIPAIVGIVVLVLAGVGYKFLSQPKVDTLRTTTTSPALGNQPPREEIDRYLAEGKLLFQQGKYDECVSKMNQVLSINGNNSVARWYIKEAAKRIEKRSKSSDPSVPGSVRRR
jgi:serine/threonine protein kinase